MPTNLPTKNPVEVTVMSTLAIIALLWLLAGLVAAIIVGTVFDLGGPDDPRRAR